VSRWARKVRDELTIERESNPESFLINSSFWLIANGQSMLEGTAVPGGLTQAEIDQAIRQGATIRALRAGTEPYGFLHPDTWSMRSSGRCFCLLHIPARSDAAVQDSVSSMSVIIASSSERLSFSEVTMPLVTVSRQNYQAVASISWWEQ
jgi:hypothetical protein